MYQTYIVKSGDTLYGISNQYGVSVLELASLNKVDANSLKIGQVLLIPSNYGSNPDNMFMYTVKNGDTLYSIAKVYGTTVDEIKKINYLTSNNLKVGQIIRIPEIYTKPDEMNLVGFTNYVVKKGDTLYSIAKKFGLSVDSLIQDNALKNYNLKVGQNLKIRTNQQEILECYGSDYVPSIQKEELYTVKKGDSLYSIAKKYGIGVDNIKNLNNLSNNNLSIGQVLKIPSSQIDKVYIVKKGDNLYSIANNYGTTIDSIKKKNNLSSNILSIGQQLLI